MTESARVSLSGIEDARRTLATFDSIARSVRQQAAQAVARCEAAADTHARTCARELEQAKTELALCLARPRPQCAALADRVRRATTKMEIARQAVRAIERAKASYAPADARFDRELETLTRGGRALLSGLIGDIAGYLDQPTGSDTPRDPNPIADGAAFFVDDDIDDMVLVPLAEIRRSDIEPAGAVDLDDEAQFDSQLADLVWAVRTLDVLVLPVVAAGAGRRDLALQDEADGNQHPRTCVQTFELFFGANPIILTRHPKAQMFRIVDGRYRVHVARRLGLHAVPARVIQPPGLPPEPAAPTTPS